MITKKAEGTIGVKKRGTTYGTIPVQALIEAGIDPRGRADVTFIESRKGHPARLVFMGVEKHAKLPGQVVIRLKQAPRSRSSRFEQQGVLFKTMTTDEAGPCDIEVHDDKLHLLLPEGFVRRSAFVKTKPDYSDDVRANPLGAGQRKADGVVVDVSSTGLTEEGNTACQMLVEAIQQLPGIQMRIFDVMRGRDHDCDPQALWDQLLSEIY